MDENLNDIQRDSEPVQPWLSRNRKMIILGGAVAVLAVGAVLSVVLTRGTPRPQTNTKNLNGKAATNNNTTTYDRPTFQRSTVVNTSTTLPQPYTPPSKKDLQQAINKLNQNSNTK